MLKRLYGTRFLADPLRLSVRSAAAQNMALFKSMVVIKLLAAGNTRLRAAMAQGDDMLPEPSTKEEALRAAVEAIFLAAKFVQLASDLAEEEEPVALFVMAHDTLLNMGNAISPDGHSWSQIGAELYEFPSGKRLNG